MKRECDDLDVYGYSEEYAAAVRELQKMFVEIAFGPVPALNSTHPIPASSVSDEELAELVDLEMQWPPED